MIRTGCVFRFLPLAAAIGLAGCDASGSVSSRPKSTYDARPSLERLAAQFLDQPESNRQVAADRVPLKFVDREGKTVDLDQYRGRSSVVLVVVKGMPQSPGGVFCPGCLAQMNALVANHPEFKKRGAEVMVVYPGASTTLSDFLLNAKVAGDGQPACPIPLLLDKDLAVCRQLDIVGDLAKPSTYILDSKGNVVYAFVGEGTTDRPSVKALLAQLDKVNGAK
jgi:peroxiredoxin